MIIWDLLCRHKRISCVYTRDLLCMHNTLVHALGQGTQGPGPKKGAWAVLGPGRAFFGSLAPARVLCMHKRSRVYTRDSFVYTQEISFMSTTRNIIGPLGEKRGIDLRNIIGLLGEKMRHRRATNNLSSRWKCGIDSREILCLIGKQMWHRLTENHMSSRRKWCHLGEK